MSYVSAQKRILDVRVNVSWLHPDNRIIHTNNEKKCVRRRSQQSQTFTRTRQSGLETKAKQKQCRSGVYYFPTNKRKRSQSLVFNKLFNKDFFQIKQTTNESFFFFFFASDSDSDFHVHAHSVRFISCIRLLQNQRQHQPENPHSTFWLVPSHTDQ